ncbi:MAG: DinB family protein [Planctomycetota bacterium]
MPDEKPTTLHSGANQTRDAADPRHALANSLDQLADLIDRLDDAGYATTGISGFDSSIGQHVRHCLDHVDALLVSLRDPESGRSAETPVAYDRRIRGTDTETDRSAGLTAVRSRANVVRTIDNATLESPLQILAIVDPAAPERRFQTTGNRELLYVFHHTVHHLAIVAAQARSLGIGVERDFGRAPATVAADRQR